MTDDLQPICEMAIEPSFKVAFAWDHDAGVFVSQSDLPGLHVEADELAEACRLAENLGRELIAERY